MLRPLLLATFCLARGLGAARGCQLPSEWRPLSEQSWPRSSCMPRMDENYNLLPHGKMPSFQTLKRTEGCFLAFSSFQTVHKGSSWQLSPVTGRSKKILSSSLLPPPFHLWNYLSGFSECV
ncbi:hypothetical protein E5288_WYG021949 [Bos mutus]|uniref:Uncharacterized protein n=1 Tax=Bos mutus TaxID=72004 RepID=A0A6B0S1C7_9CETA|nr:hypothetical protein [Bos mutus]